MSRDLSAENAAQTIAAIVYAVQFYEGVWKNGTIRYCTYAGDITWGGNTWLGRGKLFGISHITENTEISARGFVVSLSGLKPAVVALLHNNQQMGLRGRIYIGFLNGAGVLVGDPYLIDEGRQDIPSIQFDGAIGTASVAYESLLRDLERPRSRRYTHEDMQIDHPGNPSFKFVAGLQDKVISF